MLQSGEEVEINGTVKKIERVIVLDNIPHYILEGDNSGWYEEKDFKLSNLAGD